MLENPLHLFNFLPPRENVSENFLRSRYLGTFIVLNPSQDKGFNARIIDCIDRALDVFGPGSRAAIYYQLTDIHGLSREDFQSRPSIMIDQLRQMLGKTGSVLIEKLIIKEIEKSFSLRPRTGTNLDLTIAEARKKFLFH